MTYWQTADLGANPDFQKRVLGVAITEGNPQPEQWAYSNKLAMLTPEMADAYAYAIASGKTPFEAATDVTVITEGMLLSRYQFLLTPPEV